MYAVQSFYFNNDFKNNLEALKLLIVLLRKASFNYFHACLAFNLKIALVYQGYCLQPY